MYTFTKMFKMKKMHTNDPLFSIVHAMFKVAMVYNIKPIINTCSNNIKQILK